MYETSGNQCFTNIGRGHVSLENFIFSSKIYDSEPTFMHGNGLDGFRNNFIRVCKSTIALGLKRFFHHLFSRYGIHFRSKRLTHDASVFFII